MSVQCMRPGCAGAAAVRLVFDAVGCEVWLDELADSPVDSSTQAQFLCGYHGARLGVPRGWTVIDRRSPLAASVPAPPEPVAAPQPEPETGPELARVEPAGAEPAGADPEPGSLLGRAFAWAGPQRSAITERTDSAPAESDGDESAT